MSGDLGGNSIGLGPGSEKKGERPLGSPIILVTQESTLPLSLDSSTTVVLDPKGKAPLQPQLRKAHLLRREGSPLGDIPSVEFNLDLHKKHGWEEKTNPSFAVKRLSIGSGDIAPTLPEVNVHSPLSTLCHRTIRKPKRTTFKGTARKRQQKSVAGVALSPGSTTLSEPTLRDEEQADTNFLMVGVAGLHPSPPPP